MLYRTTVVLLLAAIVTMPSSAQRSLPDGYTAVVEQSSRMRKGDQIVLGNVHAGRPMVVWPSGSVEPTTRAFQDDEHVVLIFVATLTGGTETFYLNLKTKRFTLVEAILPLATEPGFKPGVTQGSLRPQ